jgi:hypothetical protein
MLSEHAGAYLTRRLKNKLRSLDHPLKHVGDPGGRRLEAEEDQRSRGGEDAVSHAKEPAIVRLEIERALAGHRRRERTAEMEIGQGALTES